MGFIVFLGFLLLLAALGAAGFEVAQSCQHDAWTILPLGQLWADLHRNSLLLLQPGIERHIAPELWTYVVFPLLQAPTWAVLGAPALLLIFLPPPRRRFDF